MYAQAGQGVRHHHHHRADPGQARAEADHRRDGQSMKPGSVIVDMAAEQGGNCELTEPGSRGEARRHHRRLHRSGQPPGQAVSTLYSNNLLRLTEELCKTKDGVVNVNMDDDAIRGLTVIKDGTVTWPPPPPSCPRRARRKAAAAPAEKGHGHGAGEPMSARSLAIVFAVGALALFWRSAPSRRRRSRRTSPCSCWPASSATW